MDQGRPDKPEGWRPNWIAIEQSEIWRDQIRPWLSAMRQDALEEKAPDLPDDPKATMEQYHYWRGMCAAYKTILDMPMGMIEIDRAIAAQEKEDAILQQQQEQRTRRAL